MHLFFSPLFSNLLPFLSEEESWHCCKVLRMGPNDEIWVTNGKGLMAKCEVKKVDNKKTELIIKEIFENFGKREYSIHLAIAPTKNVDRMEWLVEKCVEIGIDEITFLLCERSERKIIKIERLNKIAAEAMKQSGKTYFPKINELQDYKDFIKKNIMARKFVAHLEKSERKLLSKVVKPGEDYIILIGPEGDFSKEEIKLAGDNDFKPVKLGESRLRTETAGLISCHTFNLINEVS